MEGITTSRRAPWKWTFPAASGPSWPMGAAASHKAERLVMCFCGCSPCMLPTAWGLLSHRVLNQCGVVMASAWLPPSPPHPHTRGSSRPVALSPGSWGETRVPATVLPLSCDVTASRKAWSPSSHHILPLLPRAASLPWAVGSCHLAPLGSSEIAARPREHRDSKCPIALVRRSHWRPSSATA